MARNLVEYRNYGNDEGRAIRILHSHHPDVDFAACERHFRAYASAYREAISLVDANSGLYWEMRNAGGEKPGDDIPPPERAFIDEHPDIPEDTLRTMVFWIFDWHHVR